MAGARAASMSTLRSSRSARRPSLRLASPNSSNSSLLIDLMLATSESAWSLTRSMRGSAAPLSSIRCRARTVRSSSMARYVSWIKEETLANSSMVAAVVRRGAAVIRLLLYWATPKAATISGTLSLLTRSWATPTRSKKNQPTRLAATVRDTAIPIPK